MAKFFVIIELVLLVYLPDEHTGPTRFGHHFTTTGPSSKL